MKKIVSAVLAASMISASFAALTACSKTPVLRVGSWADYIDEGGKNSIDSSNKSLYEDFEDWYHEQTGKKIKVEYIPIDTNELMYSSVGRGDKYDLLCPSEYMIMKMAAEGLLQKFPETFYDTALETNYYVNNVSPYIEKIFKEGKTSDNASWWNYAAGYMWGTTGFTFNYDKVDSEVVKSWTAYTNKGGFSISAKDNVRDAYFEGLGLYYEAELLALKQLFEMGTITEEAYKQELAEMMNDTSVETMNAVENLLKKNMNKKANRNFWGFETDTAKEEVAAGNIDISYQWSGDAVTIMDEAEDEEKPIDDRYRYDYCIPDSASNLWFDGWVLMKDAEEVEAATMFVNFLSMPKNVIRNMYYIGYTSCIAGEEVFDYVQDTYGAEKDAADTAEYDLSYFFGDGYKLTADKEQLTRQLFAQYPDEETLKRCVVMQYFDNDANTRAYKMYNNVTAS